MGQQEIDIENDLEFVAGKDGFDDDDDDIPEEEEGGEGEDGETDGHGQAPKQSQPSGTPGVLKRHKKLAKAVLGKKLKSKRLDLAFEPAETEAERQLN